MPLGEARFENFKLITSNPSDPTSVLDLPKFSATSCCYELPVFAELVYTKDFNNDKSSVIYFYDNAFSDALLELEQYISGTWTKIADLNDATYGTYSAFGTYTNPSGENVLSFEIDWSLILAAFGIGKYRIKTVETNIFGTTNRYSLEWTLKAYNQNIVDKTTRISWWVSGLIGDSSNDQKKRDFGNLNFYNEIRLYNSLFWSKTSEYEKEFVKYQNGQQVWTKDERTRSYKFELNGAPNYVHELLSGEVFQSDTIMITDYNSNNPAMLADCSPEMLEKYVKLSSNYEPKWNFGSKYASVECTFTNEYQNFVRKRC
jgi:hypothetical protein